MDQQRGMDEERKDRDVLTSCLIFIATGVVESILVAALDAVKEQYSTGDWSPVVIFAMILSLNNTVLLLVVRNRILKETTISISQYTSYRGIWIIYVHIIRRMYLPVILVYASLGFCHYNTIVLFFFISKRLIITFKNNTSHHNNLIHIVAFMIVGTCLFSSFKLVYMLFS